MSFGQEPHLQSGPSCLEALLEPYSACQLREDGLMPTTIGNLYPDQSLLDHLKLLKLLALGFGRICINPVLIRKSPHKHRGTKDRTNTRILQTMLSRIRLLGALEPQCRILMSARLLLRNVIYVTVIGTNIYIYTHTANSRVSASW